MKITVNPNLEKFVTKKIASGQFANPNVVVTGRYRYYRSKSVLPKFFDDDRR